MCIVQGRNEVRWRLEHETSLPPHVRTWGLSEANVLFWKKVLMTFLELFGLRSDSAPGESCPLAPLVTSLVLCNENRKIFRKQTNFQVRTSWAFAIFENNKAWILHRLPRKVTAAFQVSSCSFVSLPCLPHAFFRCGLVLVLLIIKRFGHSTSCFFKVRYIWE